MDDDLLPYFSNLTNCSMVCFREENWSAKAPKNGTEERPEGEAEERGGNYDGPPGMDPDGVIESNWDKVSLLLCHFTALAHNLSCSF